MEKRDGVRKALNEIDERYVDEAGATKLEKEEYQKPGKSGKSAHIWLRCTLTAAGILLVLGIGTIRIIKQRQQTAYTDPAETEGAQEGWHIDGRIIRLESGGCVVHLENSETMVIPSEFEEGYMNGDLVRVYFAKDGCILETWPAMASGVTKVELLEEGSFSDLDMQVIEQLEESGNTVYRDEEDEIGSEGLYIPEETVTLKVLSPMAPFSGEQKGWFADLLKEKFNVELEIYNGPEDYMLDMDIMIWADKGEEYEDAIENGDLLDWNQNGLLSDYGADIKENLSAVLEHNAEENGGVVYGFTDSAVVPGSGDNHSGLFYTWDIRWDLYEELGKPEINNLEDYLNLMKAMKEIEPTDDNGNETYALSLWPDWDENMLMYAKAFAAAYYGYDAWGMGFYDVRTGDVYGALEEDGPYYTSLKFMNQMYREGLLDPASKAQDYKAAFEKIEAGGCLSSIVDYAGQELYNSEEHIARNKLMCSLIPNEASPVIYEPTDRGYEWTISARTEYPELCMEIINWLATPEGALTCLYGPRGACWDYDEDGNLYLTAFGISTQENLFIDMSEVGYSGTFGDGFLPINTSIWNISSLIPNDPDGQSFLYTMWDSMQPEPSCETEALWRTYTGEKQSAQYLQHNENAVHVPYTVENIKGVEKPEGGETLTQWEQVAETIVNGSWECVYAKSEEEFEQLWAQMSEYALRYGYDYCLALTKEQAADRYEAEQKTAYAKD